MPELFAFFVGINVRAAALRAFLSGSVRMNHDQCSARQIFKPAAGDAPRGLSEGL
jgi:hypothetical protein